MFVVLFGGKGRLESVVATQPSIKIGCGNAAFFNFSPFFSEVLFCHLDDVVVVVADTDEDVCNQILEE
jgi:hypothetical protein